MDSVKMSHSDCIKEHAVCGKKQIEAIVFDLGNVLVDFDHAIAARRISAFTDKTPVEIYQLFFDSKITGLFEQGKIPPKGFFSEISLTLNLKLDYEQFLPIWNEIFFLSDKNREVYKLAGMLKPRYKTAVLSNINVLHLEYLEKNFPVFNVFDHVIASCESGFIKPDPLIYQQAIGLLGTAAENIFYTDDRPDLIQASRALGIQGFVFKNSEQLKNDLLGCGVDIKAATNV